jgi:hypothetical protein
LTNQNLLQLLRAKARQEQNLTLEVIELIRQVEERKLYLQLGFSSLFDFVTKDLGYEPSSAMRRIQAARLVKEIPQVKEKIESKKLSLSVVSQAQSFFRKEAKDSGTKLSVPKKLEILKRLENKSTREAEKELVKINPQVVKKTERVRELSEELTELKVVLDKVTREKLDELKAFLSHQNPDLSYQGLLKLIIEKTHVQVLKAKGMNQRSFLKSRAANQTSVLSGSQSMTQKTTDSKSRTTNQAATGTEPRTTNQTAVGTESRAINQITTRSKSRTINQKTTFSKSGKSSQIKTTKTPDMTQMTPLFSFQNPEPTENPLPAPAVKSGANKRKAIPQKTKQLVWQRDQGKCQFQGSESQQPCGSTYFLEIDHIKRVRHGGSNDPVNLQLLCRNHNQWRN